MLKKKKLLIAFAILACLAIGGYKAFMASIVVHPPLHPAVDVAQLRRVTLAPNVYRCGDSWLRKSETGLWELYTEGAPYKRGLEIGQLTAELNDYQEEILISQIRHFIPSDFYLSFIKNLVLWFNRHLDRYVIDEYRQEIYGMAQERGDDRFAFIAPRYARLLNYHAAHDIGHALLDRNLIACTAFAAWDQSTRDGKLLHGRNFDFYGGEHFSDNKVLCFYRPEKGYAFVSIAWAGMIGVVSGMNEKGLAVTINASKDTIPSTTGTPISLLVREILQYAKNINEAQAIAARRTTFVSEAIMVSSAEDGRTAVIEKSPSKMVLRRSEGNSIVVTNHFLAEPFLTEKNRKAIAASSSPYRYLRVRQLLANGSKLDAAGCAAILRDRQGLDGKEIGLTNEKAINQLVCHHSVIFSPEDRVLWVSAGPYQIGRYIAYDLRRIFAGARTADPTKEIYDRAASLPSDRFLTDGGYDRFLAYTALREQLRRLAAAKKNAAAPDERTVERFIGTNKEYYGVYALLGDCFAAAGQQDKAGGFYRTALSKEMPTLNEKLSVEKKLRKMEEKEKKAP